MYLKPIPQGPCIPPDGVVLCHEAERNHGDYVVATISFRGFLFSGIILCLSGEFYGQHVKHMPVGIDMAGSSGK